MAFHRPNHLSKEQLAELLGMFKPDEVVSVVRIRYRNKDDIRRTEAIAIEDLKRFIFECLENEDQPGGDIELKIPTIGKTLVGHHDGVYWLEP